ncbi:uncharacterized protein LOC134296479 isoform X2 [Anolis carolinensis]|uniref:uncharacterized protein LOC134296479 isoform X2 n=1 Tax=Anolis carolinensis TaxID=28377 RepID=UPI002F2B3F4D
MHSNPSINTISYSILVIKYEMERLDFVILNIIQKNINPAIFFEVYWETHLQRLNGTTNLITKNKACYYQVSFFASGRTHCETSPVNVTNMFGSLSGCISHFEGDWKKGIQELKMETNWYEKVNWRQTEAINGPRLEELTRKCKGYDSSEINPKERNGTNVTGKCDKHEAFYGERNLRT